MRTKEDEEEDEEEVAVTEVRQIVSGLREHYKKDQLKGRKILVVRFWTSASAQDLQLFLRRNVLILKEMRFSAASDGFSGSP